MRLVLDQILIPIADLAHDPAAQMRAALHNCAKFDQMAHAGWLMRQTEGVRHQARRRPPNRVYALTADGGEELHVVIVGYGLSDVFVAILGVPTGAGSVESPIPIPGSELRDCTVEMRQRYL